MDENEQASVSISNSSVKRAVLEVLQSVLDGNIGEEILFSWLQRSSNTSNKEAVEAPNEVMDKFVFSQASFTRVFLNFLREHLVAEEQATQSSPTQRIGDGKEPARQNEDDEDDARPSPRHYDKMFPAMGENDSLRRDMKKDTKKQEAGKGGGKKKIRPLLIQESVTGAPAFGEHNNQAIGSSGLSDHGGWPTLSATSGPGKAKVKQEGSLQQNSTSEAAWPSLGEVLSNGKRGSGPNAAMQGAGTGALTAAAGLSTAGGKKKKKRVKPTLVAPLGDGEEGAQREPPALLPPPPQLQRPPPLHGVVAPPSPGSSLGPAPGLRPPTVGGQAPAPRPPPPGFGPLTSSSPPPPLPADAPASSPTTPGPKKPSRGGMGTPETLQGGRLPGERGTTTPHQHAQLQGGTQTGTPASLDRALSAATPSSSQRRSLCAAAHSVTALAAGAPDGGGAAAETGAEREAAAAGDPSSAVAFARVWAALLTWRLVPSIATELQVLLRFLRTPVNQKVAAAPARCPGRLRPLYGLLEPGWGRRRLAALALGAAPQPPAAAAAAGPAAAAGAGGMGGGGEPGAPPPLALALLAPLLGIIPPGGGGAGGARVEALARALRAAGADDLATRLLSRAAAAAEEGHPGIGGGGAGQATGGSAASSHSGWARLPPPFPEDGEASRNDFRSRAGAEVFRRREAFRDGFLGLLRDHQRRRSQLGYDPVTEASTLLRPAKTLLAGLTEGPGGAAELRWAARLWAAALCRHGPAAAAETDAGLLAHRAFLKDKEKVQKLHQIMVQSPQEGRHLSKRSNKKLPYRRTLGGDRGRASNVHQPILYFPGNQEFFFLFLRACDSYSFNTHLSDCLNSEISRLADSMQPEERAPTIARLKLLGKFLGVLTFSPRWVLEEGVFGGGGGGGGEGADPGVRAALEGAVAEADAGASSRAGRGGLPGALRAAAAARRLSAAAPWAAAFLAMAQWDPVSLRTIYYGEAISLMKSILVSADDFKIGSPGMNSTRLFVTLELDAFFEDLMLAHPHTAAAAYKEVEVTLPASEGTQLGLDDIPIVFDHQFLELCCPYLQELQRNMHAEPGLEKGSSRVRQAGQQLKKLRPYNITADELGSKLSDIGISSPDQKGGSPQDQLVEESSPTPPISTTTKDSRSDTADGLAADFFLAFPQLKPIAEFVAETVAKNASIEALNRVVPLAAANTGSAYKARILSKGIEILQSSRVIEFLATKTQAAARERCARAAAAAARRRAPPALAMLVPGDTGPEAAHVAAALAARRAAARAPALARAGLAAAARRAVEAWLKDTIASGKQSLALASQPTVPPSQPSGLMVLAITMPSYDGKETCTGYDDIFKNIKALTTKFEIYEKKVNEAKVDGPLNFLQYLDELLAETAILIKTLHRCQETASPPTALAGGSEHLDANNFIQASSVPINSFFLWTTGTDTELNDGVQKRQVILRLAIVDLWSTLVAHNVLDGILDCEAVRQSMLDQAVLLNFGKIVDAFELEKLSVQNPIPSLPSCHESTRSVLLMPDLDWKQIGTLFVQLVFGIFFCCGSNEETIDNAQMLQECWLDELQQSFIASKPVSGVSSCSSVFQQAFEFISSLMSALEATLEACCLNEDTTNCNVLAQINFGDSEHAPLLLFNYSSYKFCKASIFCTQTRHSSAKESTQQEQASGVNFTTSEPVSEFINTCTQLKFTVQYIVKQIMSLKHASTL